MKKRSRSARPGAKKKMKKTKGKVRAKASAAKLKKTTKRKKPAPRRKPTAKARPGGATYKAVPPMGPELASTDKGVHLMFVRDEAVACMSHADPTAHELQQVKNSLPRVPAVTDVVVFGGKPYQFAGGALQQHPHVHTLFPETVLRLRRSEGNRAVWWSEEPFTTTIVEDPLPGFPQSPNPAPYPFSTRPETVRGSGGIHVARSTVPVPDASGHQYKMTFTMGGRAIDPHMDI